MENKFTIRLNAAKKGYLAACAAIAIVAPLALGLLTLRSAPAMAQTADAPHPGTEAALRHQIESIEEKGEADYSVMIPSLVQRARSQSENTRKNMRVWGALKSVAFRENEGTADAYLVRFEHQLAIAIISPLQPDGKIGPAFVVGPTIERDGNGPSPGVEAAIKQELDGELTGNPALGVMSPGLQSFMQSNWKTLNAREKMLGAVQTIAFQKVNAWGLDVYQVTFANGTDTIQAAPLTDGKLTEIWHTDSLFPHQPQHAGTEAWLRRHIAAVLSGKPDYDEMGPVLADAMHLQWPSQITIYKSLGAFQSLAFEGSNGAAGDRSAVDVYLATFQHGKVRWHIQPPDAAGKVDRTLYFDLVK